MKLRWYSTKNHVTSEQVRAYSQENQVSTMEAKDKLVNRTGPRLQYWDGHSMEWIDVPYVMEIL